MKPFISGTLFGSITVSGQRFEHDIVISLGGKIRARQKELSKAKYGTSHLISAEEAKNIFEPGAEKLVIGTGQNGLVELSDEAIGYFRQENCTVVLLPTPQASTAWNEANGSVIGMFHVTC